jgi:hypothetical protein
MKNTLKQVAPISFLKPLPCTITILLCIYLLFCLLLLYRRAYHLRGKHPVLWMYFSKYKATLWLFLAIRTLDEMMAIFIKLFSGISVVLFYIYGFILISSIAPFWFPLKQCVHRVHVPFGVLDKVKAQLVFDHRVILPVQCSDKMLCEHVFIAFTDTSFVIQY